eukprot:sb/3463339/
MAQTFSTEFSIPLSDPEKAKNYSDYKNFHGFFWYISVDLINEPGYYSVYLHCKPIDTVEEWSCSANWTLKVDVSRTERNWEYTFSNTNCFGYGARKFMTADERKVIKISANVSVISSTIGKSAIELLPPTGLIQLSLPLSSLGSKTSYFTGQHGIERNWVVEIRKPKPGKVRLRLDGYSRETGEKENKGGSALVLVKNNPNLKKTIFLGQFDLETQDESMELTFVIGYSSSYNQPSMMNFGREYLSLPAHGNNSFLLKDNTSIPLNSLVLARNSPVLKGFIEKEGDLDHDVTDFVPEAVRIFVDACYTGTLEKLSDETEFKIFCDVVKMVAVFKVDWAKGGCLEFYRRHLPKPSEDFTAYWKYAVFALDSAVSHEVPCFLDYLLSKIPINKTQFQFSIIQLVGEITKRSHLDLILTLIVEFDLVEKFIQQILVVMMFKNRIPLLNYWLENFNFSLCNEETLPLTLLAEAVEKTTDPRLCCNFMKHLKNADVNGIEEAAVDNDGDLIPKDGTLATLARNRWKKNKYETWPCSNKRPFSLARRELQKEESGGDADESAGDDIMMKQEEEKLETNDTTSHIKGA